MKTDPELKLETREIQVIQKALDDLLRKEGYAVIQDVYRIGTALTQYENELKKQQFIDAVKKEEADAHPMKTVNTT